ncbi:YxeA family protein [Listeria costaricensis]|uniref:YxeA family protein n=1 Tax=Listeria costaricensis TaxID=2026604 RepID=UPI000C08BB04|nr:YxeA family protein [Listeria costaricensis]
MKKAFFITISVILALGILAVLALRFINFNQIGADQYYVQITQNGDKQTEYADDGEDISRYNYELTGYDENGKAKKLSFDAEKNLRLNAYLRVYYKNDVVSSYEEVQKQDIPQKAQTQLATQ